MKNRPRKTCRLSGRRLVALGASDGAAGGEDFDFGESPVSREQI